jgi:hypothetical protein
MQIYNLIKTLINLRLVALIQIWFILGLQLCVYFQRLWFLKNKNKIFLKVNYKLVSRVLRNKLITPSCFKN